MKKILFTLAMLLGFSAGAQSLQPNTGATSTANGAFIFTPIPLTNQPAFTNTLVPPTNAAALQLPDVLTLLLTLQTNIEKTLPVLDFIQSNANVVSVSPTNIVQGFAAPITSIPSPLTPTGAASGTTRPQVSSLSVRIGTNNLDIDAATLQGIFILRNGLQQTLPFLQSLNGTSPSQTNPVVTAPSSFNPGVTNFMPNPFTGLFATPLTNASPF